MPDPTLSADEARTAALRAQGLLVGADRPRRPAAVLARVGALQLDTISVLARSHELVCLARTGRQRPGAITAACWGSDTNGCATTFEYWAHAASILPIELWPWFAARRRARQQRHVERDGPLGTDGADVLAALADGPLTAHDLGGAKLGGEWWDWSPVKASLERLLSEGTVVCTSRRRWQREYRLATDAVPDALLGAQPDDAACARHLTALAGRHLGVATAGDLADYWRLSQADVRAALPDTPLVAVTVEGWGQPAWADPEALATLGRRRRSRTTLLSPFDSLVWHRARTERMFGMRHRLEAYTPAAKREHGYFAMPVLAGGRLVARVDPGRRGATLVAKQVTFATSASSRLGGAVGGSSARAGAVPQRAVRAVPQRAVGAVADALWEAAGWVDATAIEVGRVEPAEAGPWLTDALGLASRPRRSRAPSGPSA